jgi:hypothetical protein
MTQVADRRRSMAQVAYGVGGHDPGSRQEKKHGSGSIRGRRP